jgi:bifunctional non-homologous end joining protein LigD
MPFVSRKQRREAKSPLAFVAPMQCKPVGTLPEEEGWAFEIKFDGYRCLAVKRGARVELFSRNRKLLNARFPEVVRALTALAQDFVIDGEIVALDEAGRPAFQVLQNSASQSVPIHYYAFDALNIAGQSLVNLSFEERRDQLEALLADVPEPVRLSPLLTGSTETIARAVRKLGLEGVIGKRLDSAYETGERTGAWIKHRTSNEQEFVIGGYVPGSRGFDSLLVGVYVGERLVYTAKVKNGFVPRTRDQIAVPLKRLVIPNCPFSNLPEKKVSRWGESLTAEKMKECRWVKPLLVCQVGFVEWTNAGHLRHCHFVGMRDDKRPKEVVRET